MQILVPIAAESPFFPADHYFFPKSLIEVAGQPMIERVVENLCSCAAAPSFIFVAQQETVSRFSLDRTLSLLTDSRCMTLALRKPTKGALCTALMAVDHLNLDAPIVVANGDQVINADLAKIIAYFSEVEADAGVVVFESVHPRWSYVRLDDSGLVQQAAEKIVISRNAIAGLYYFKTASKLVEAGLRAIENNAQTEGQFFIAPCLNEIILDGGRVAAYRINARDYHSFYSPEKIKQFEDSTLLLRQEGTPDRVSDVRVFIPAAGEGSRFQKAGYGQPKPFIDVLGRPMIQHVIDNVTPEGATAHLLLRADHLSNQSDALAMFAAQGHVIHKVEKLTEGTACTLLLARAAYDDDRPLLVANSDQYVDFSVNDYLHDCIDRDLDGSILVFRDAERNPKWSFVRLDSNGLVCEVAEKKPISDLATVGIYLFRRGADFVSAAIDMIARNDRVSNEFYTCPVYNYMIASGARIGVFEVAPAAMHGLGTPEDLEKFLVTISPRKGAVERVE